MIERDVALERRRRRVRAYRIARRERRRHLVEARRRRGVAERGARHDLVQRKLARLTFELEHSLVHRLLFPFVRLDETRATGHSGRRSRQRRIARRGVRLGRRQRRGRGRRERRDGQDVVTSRTQPVEVIGVGVLPVGAEVRIRARAVDPLRRRLVTRRRLVGIAGGVLAVPVEEPAVLDGKAGVSVRRRGGVRFAALRGEQFLHAQVGIEVARLVVILRGERAGTCPHAKVPPFGGELVGRLLVQRFVDHRAGGRRREGKGGF